MQQKKASHDHHHIVEDGYMGPKDSGLSQKEDIITPSPRLTITAMFLHLQWYVSWYHYNKKILKSKIMKKSKTHSNSFPVKLNRSLEVEGTFTKHLFPLSWSKWIPKKCNGLLKVTQLSCSRVSWFHYIKMKIMWYYFDRARVWK